MLVLLTRCLIIRLLGLNPLLTKVKAFQQVWVASLAAESSIWQHILRTPIDESAISVSITNIGSW